MLTKLSTSKAGRFVPGFELLEDRVTPSTTLGDPQVSVIISRANTMIAFRVEGTSLNDTVSVSRGWRTQENGVYKDWGIHITANGQTKWYAAQGRDDGSYRIIFNGNDGNDTFQNNTAIRSIAHGGAGNDVLYGGYALDLLFGDGGNDTLFALSGPTRYYGRTGDELHGGDGADYLSGSEANDSLYGEVGSDTLVGNAGNDMLFGGIGADNLYGGIGDDTLDGGDDGFADYLNGGAGRDKFQREGWGIFNGPIVASYDLDVIADFEPGIDSVFGTDRRFGVVFNGGGGVAPLPVLSR